MSTTYARQLAQRLVIGVSDPTLRQSGDAVCMPELGRLRVAPDIVVGVAFAPDGRTLATASNDQTVILWDLPSLEGLRNGEVREACLRAGGPLDKPTWDQYAPGVSYQDTCAGR